MDYLFPLVISCTSITVAEIRLLTPLRLEKQGLFHPYLYWHDLLEPTQPISETRVPERSILYSVSPHELLPLFRLVLLGMFSCLA